jgi:MFS family permease
MPSNDRDPILSEILSDEEVAIEGPKSSLACDPTRKLHRFLILPLICLLSFGSYFCYDNPAALQDIMIKDLQISTSQYSAFYAWYSWPNVILSMVGGYLIDRVFGIRLGAIVFGTFVMGGQLLFSLGAFVNKIWLMDAARFIYGIGGENLAVAQNTYATSWFKSSELNFIFGLQLSMSRVGSTVNMNVMQPLYRALGSFSGTSRLGMALLIASSTCVFSFICSLILAFFDRRRVKMLKLNNAETGEKIQLKDIVKFRMSFWFICIICVAYYSAVFPFISLGLVFFERKYDLHAKDASALNSILYIVGAVASPVMGLLIDFAGKNVFWVLLGVCSTLGCHAMLAFSFAIPPAFVMVLMGLSYSVLASALWPMVVFVVKPNERATAYGIMQSIQNLGLAVVNIMTGIIVDSKGYLILEVFFMMCLCAAMLCTVLLYLWDLNNEGSLNESGPSRRKRIALADSLIESSDSAPSTSSSVNVDGSLPNKA